jgi:Fe-S-cluster containining protein
MKPSKLIEKYLELDADNDYVFRSAPCPFLDHENYCMVYESRPLACREYPHTNRKRFYQVLDLSLKNTEICPAVADIFEHLKI